MPNGFVMESLGPRFRARTLSLSPPRAEITITPIELVLADLPAQLEAVDLREHEVEERDVGSLLLDQLQRRRRRRATRRRRTARALRLERTRSTMLRSSSTSSTRVESDTGRRLPLAGRPAGGDERRGRRRAPVDSRRARRAGSPAAWRRRRRFDDDLAAVGLDDAAGDGQAEALCPHAD